MVLRTCPILLLLLLTAGCFDKESTPLVPDSPFGRRVVPPTPTQATYAPAATAVAARVDMLGRNLLSANPQIGIRPLFRTIGAPQPEIFHQGTAELFITEGLVKQCTSDSQLAALLCLELGKMISEREVQAARSARQPNLDPPPDVPVGNNYGSFGGAPDLTRQAELAKYRTPAAREAPPPPPDPNDLARAYLQKAGYPATELDAVAPLLRQAANSSSLEKSVTTGPPRPWTNN
jgi:hypothetical protein